MSDLVLQGAFTALITPFNDDGSLDEEGLRRLVAFQLDEGIDGLVPCGTTGESATMTPEERLKVIEIVATEVSGQVPVVAGTGTNNTAESIAFTQQVSTIKGVDAALVVTPYYNKPGQEELFRHFSAIAEEGGLPVVLYNVPGRTAVSLSTEIITRLSALEQIIAIKEATADMAFASEIRNAVPKSFALLSGDDFTTFPLVTIGGQGCISVVSNLLPKTMSAMCAAGMSGELAKGRELHLQIQGLAKILFAKSNPIPVKAAASLMGLCGPTLRAPLYAPDEAFLSTLKEVLHHYDLL